MVLCRGSLGRVGIWGGLFSRLFLGMGRGMRVRFGLLGRSLLGLTLLFVGSSRFREGRLGEDKVECVWGSDAED